MKKFLIYLITIIIGASIPIYFLLIWEPLEDKSVLSNNIIEDKDVLTDNIQENKVIEINNYIEIENDENSLFNTISNDRKEKLNTIIKKLSVLDVVKINNYFADSYNSNNIKMGIEIARKRMSKSDYEVFKSILEDYVNFDILE